MMKHVVVGFAHSKDCFTCKEIGAMYLEFGRVENEVVLPFKGFVEEVMFEKEC